MKFLLSYFFFFKKIVNIAIKFFIINPKLVNNFPAKATTTQLFFREYNHMQKNKVRIKLFEIYLYSLQVSNDFRGKRTGGNYAECFSK